MGQQSIHVGLDGERLHVIEVGKVQTIVSDTILVTGVCEASEGSERVHSGTFKKLLQTLLFLHVLQVYEHF